MIAVHSLRGGVGSSTLAVNLGVGLSALWREPTILLDLTMTAGQVALMLNMTLKRTWADLAHYSAGELDLDALSSIIGGHESGLHFIAAPTFPSEVDTLRGETLGAALQIFKSQYEYIVADLPHDFSEFSIQTLDVANIILMVASPDMASIRAMIAAIDTFAMGELAVAIGAGRRAKEDEVDPRVGLMVRVRLGAAVRAGDTLGRYEIEAPIGRDPKHRTRMAVVPDGRASTTGYRVRERFGGWTLLELDLVTGRTHQIRVHLEAIGHPVAGDPVYGTGTSRRGPQPAGDWTPLERLFLHAWRIQLTSPSGGHLIRAEAPLPPELEGVLEGLRGAASDLAGPEGRR